MGLFTENSALLIIDMINDFILPDGALVVPDAVNIIPKIASLASQARELGVPVIYTNDSHDPDDAEFERWPPHAITGTDGAIVVKGLEPGSTDYIIQKKKYSSFFGTNLEELLSELGIEHLIITGTVTNICVYSTALDAVMRGYRITVPEDCVSGLTEEDHKFALRLIEQVLGGEVV